MILNRPVYGVVLLVALAGCTIPHAEISPEGFLYVTPTATPNSGEGLSSEWVIKGIDREDLYNANLQFGSEQGRTTLRILAEGREFALVRRTRAALLASPFLRWRWRVGKHLQAVHPVSLVVGFFGGAQSSGSLGGQPLVFVGQILPPHDRLLRIQWGEKSLTRGSLEPAKASARYTARGGAANAETWWAENIDLSRLYARLWPKDRIERAQVTFIGIAVDSNPAISAAEFADIVLHR